MRRTGGIEKYVNKRLRQRILDRNEPEWLFVHKRRRYLVKSHLAAPAWLTRAMLEPLVLERDRMNALGLGKWVIDHIIPIDHPFVCGLTVPWNLQVVPYAHNAWKGNRWHPDQLQLEI